MNEEDRYGDYCDHHYHFFSRLFPRIRDKEVLAFFSEMSDHPEETIV